MEFAVKERDGEGKEEEQEEISGFLNAFYPSVYFESCIAAFCFCVERCTEQSPACIAYVSIDV